MKSNEKKCLTFKNCSPVLKGASQEASRAIFGDKQKDNEEAQLAACYLLVRYGYGAHRSAKLMNARLPLGKGYHTDQDVYKATGGLPEVAKRLAKGGAIPKGAFGRWTPNFWLGLMHSGALIETKGKSQWATSPLFNRPALKEAFLGHLPFHCRVDKSKGGDTLTIYGLWASRMGADDPSGTEVLAGLLAGGRLGKYEGRTWLGVSAREWNAEFLKSYGIPFVKPKGKWVGRGSYLVSPFWGALLSEEMPEAFGRWFLAWRGRKGMCPLLPWAFLKMASGKKFVDDCPKGAVPYLALRVGLRVNHGIGLGAIREEALREFGFVSVDQRLRKAWLRWMALRGLRPADFPEAKVPIDFTDAFCNNVVSEREEQSSLSRG